MVQGTQPPSGIKHNNSIQDEGSSIFLFSTFKLTPRLRPSVCVCLCRSLSLSLSLSPNLMVGRMSRAIRLCLPRPRTALSCPAPRPISSSAPSERGTLRGGGVTQQLRWVVQTQVGGEISDCGFFPDALHMRAREDSPCKTHSKLET